MIAIEEYVDSIVAEDTKLKSRWEKVHKSLYESARKYLWDDTAQKFVPHIFLEEGSPFPREFDEEQIFYHGGTAVAIEAGLLDSDEIAASLRKMRENVEQAGAASIGLNLYPIYPEGLFLSKSMRSWNYMNGGDWTWFGARMVRQLARYGFAADALRELEPMMNRVLEHDGFFEWWTRANEPMGARNFKGSAGVLMESILELRKWAREPANLVFVFNNAFNTRGMSNAEVADLLQELGYDGIEHREVQGIFELRDELEQRGLKLFADEE